MVIFPQQEVKILGLDFCGLTGFHTHSLNYKTTKHPRDLDGALKLGHTSSDPYQFISYGDTSQNMGCDLLFFQGLFPTLEMDCFHPHTDGAISCRPQQAEIHW